MASREKTLLVLGSAGAGKATTTGCLLFKFGGIDMLTMERFQKEGIQQYDHAARDLQSRGIQPAFYTPNFHVTVLHRASQADCVLLVIPADLNSADLKNEFDRASVHAKQIVVLINKMDNVSWSEETFQKTVHSVKSAADSVTIIPYSALKGDNSVEPSPNTTWFKGPTILAALEASFRA